MVEQTRYYEQTSRQSFFEESSNEAIKRNRVIRRFEELKMEENSKVEERRERCVELASYLVIVGSHM